jgi:hypothetical protein
MGEVEVLALYMQVSKRKQAHGLASIRAAPLQLRDPSLCFL